MKVASVVKAVNDMQGFGPLDDWHCYARAGDILTVIDRTEDANYSGWDYKVKHLESGDEFFCLSTEIEELTHAERTSLGRQRETGSGSASQPEVRKEDCGHCQTAGAQSAYSASDSEELPGYRQSAILQEHQQPCGECCQE